MSESKYSQNDGMDGKSLNHVILSVLRYKKENDLWNQSFSHGLQAWFVHSFFQLSKHINNYLSIPSITWFLRTDNRIQSKTL